MKLPRLWLPLVILARICCADLLSDAISKLPPCGLQCIIAAIPDSACEITDSRCICTDSGLADKVQTCVLSTCKPEEAIGVARVQAQTCGFPERSRKVDMWACLSVEILAIMCLFLRLYSRWYTATRFELDDYVMMAVAVLFVTFVSLGRYAGMLAFGADIWTVPADSITQASKIFYVDEAFYLVILPLTKLSLLCFYLRIFPQRLFRIATYVIMATIIVSGLVILFMQLFQCTPISYVWEGWRGDFGPHSCLNVNVLAYAAGGISIAQDVVILVLPIPVLLRLNTTRRAKAGIMFMFSLGIFILITSCIRLRFIVRFARSTNPTWDYTDAMIWSSIEVCVSVIVTSLPAIRVLLSRSHPELFGTHLGASHGKSSQGTDRSHGQGGSAALDSKRGAAAHHHHHHRSQSSSTKPSRLLSLLALTRPDSPAGSAESQLELGDKSRGQVQTEIGVAASDDDDDDGGISSSEAATTDTRTGTRERPRPSRSLGRGELRAPPPNSSPSASSQGSGIRVMHTHTTTTTASVGGQQGGDHG